MKKKKILVIKLLLLLTVKYMMSLDNVFYVIVTMVFSFKKVQEKEMKKLKENGPVSKTPTELDIVTNITD